MKDLTYQSNIMIAGQWFRCVENYESIVRRMDEANFKVEDEGATDIDMRWHMPGPIELTVAAESGPTRLAIQAASLTAVIEVPENEQPAVDE